MVGTLIFTFKFHLVIVCVGACEDDGDS